ncbi:T9SS type A sorting domain-containing protein [Brumimicrobium glaciale]|uniref:T9SS type A sorting domain-containing protein n=1 Tax=Brumimicrobium glaciale TaxID=200475 RepID=A0A4Q4KKY4_9FLAO|nr:S8 family serine peptidase [Brumimicrobium glaciale]RYM32994.1 T9SS type A sorting domain-containing protein [Brumimicrobium glaciale]
MKKLSSVLFALLFCFSILAQDSPRNHIIHLGEKPFQIEGSIAQNWENIQNTNNEFEGELIVLVQFNAIPSEENKATLLSNGIELLKYIPNFSWVARVKPTATAEILMANNVRNISEIKSEWKISSAIQAGNIPSYSGTNDNAQVRILFFATPKNASFTSILGEYEVTIGQVDNTLNSVKLSASATELIKLSAHPLVQYIEFIEPPIENETILQESERIMSTYISNNPAKNYFFNGSGANIAVDESGTFDPIENPNLRGRIDRTFETPGAPSGHKTNVGMRMAKAGNIDPTQQGTAFGATLYSGGFSTQDAASNGINIVNRSYGWGCPTGPETYNGTSANYDFYVRTNPTFIITHSAGNIGESTCYAGSPGWGNITGMPKMAKNIFNVGSSGDNGELTDFSSRGPAKDGRLLPHIVSPGQGGTSYASPNLAGVFAQLIEAYRFHNNNITPDAGLLKAIIMNTADDMLNPGPDFQTGFGHVNARRAYEVVNEGNHLEASITNGANNNHNISVPANVKELKVMVYWVDWEASAGISTRTLVNDLDITLTDPSSASFQPWVLNPTFNAIALDEIAVRATDTLNNNEQITIDNPQSGSYQLNVQGTMVPQGPQTYYMTYEFVFDEVIVTHPHGGEKFVPGDLERIRWDATSTGQSFAISYSQNNGTSWSSIATGVGSNDRYYDWNVPQDLTNDALIRIERGNLEGQSDATFIISQQPDDFSLAWSCADSSLFSWDALPNADGYIVYRIVGDYMDSVDYTTTNAVILNGLSLTATEYVSISAVVNGVKSRRVTAVERAPSDLNCNENDIGSIQILTPGVANLPSCMSSNLSVKIKLRNWGVNSVDTLPVSYRLNGGIINIDTVFVNVPSASEYDFTFTPVFNLLTGSNTIEVWTSLNGDLITMNDSIISNIMVYQSVGAGANLMQDFDNFSNCSNANNCELTNCSLQDGWYNIPNGSGDDIDWRTNNGSTLSSGTGPSSDHTSGSGKYLYIEGSGPCNNSSARLYSPCIDLTGINNAQLSFWYHALGSSIGELHVDAIANGEFYEDIMTPIVGEKGDQWINQVVDLSQFSNQNIVLIIRGSNGPNSWYSDLAIDDINITTLPIADFSVNETELCADEIITISNTSANADTYEWNFLPNTVNYEAGTNNNSINPQVSFNAPGFYSIELIASNANGDDALSFTDFIYVWEEQPQLSGNPFCSSDSIIIQANNRGTFVEYYLNGSVVYSGTDSSFFFENAVESDEIFITYSINSNCKIYSDTLTITYVDVEVGITQIEDQVNAVAIDAQYQWINCFNDSLPIIGDTNNIFTPSENGAYALEVTENGCTERSECFEFILPPYINYASDSINIFPNPTKNNVTLQFGVEKEFIDIQIYTVLGQLISKMTAQNTSMVEIDLPETSTVYMIHVESEDVNRVFRIVKD